MPTLLDDALVALRQRFPQLAGEERRDGESHAFHLSAPRESEFRLTVRSYGDIALEISAAPGSIREAGAYFWHMPFELPASRSRAELVDEFVSSTFRLISLPSRIVQTRGLFCWSFRCEVYENGSWLPFYSHAVLRPCRTPAIRGRSRVYESHAAYVSGPRLSG